MTRSPRAYAAAISPLDASWLRITTWVPEAAELLTRQRGVVHRRQLRELGVTHHRVEHEIDQHRWSAVAPDVVAAQNAPLTKEQRRWLGVLHAGPHSALTHATACEVAGLRWTEDPLVHVLTSRGDLGSGLPGLRFHQTRRDFDGWVVLRQDAPASVDLEHAVLLTSERDQHTRRAVGRLAAAVQQRLTTPELLLDASHHIVKLRHGAMFRLALGDIAGGAQSFAEIDIGRLCREAGLMPPVRQAVRRDADGRRRYLDCSWRLPGGRRVVLEVDGSFHMLVALWWQDLRRERAIVGWGRVVLRCASVELRLDPQSVVRDLRAVGVPEAAPSPGFVSRTPA